MRSPREIQIRTAERGELGRTQPGLDREREQGMVAATGPRGAVGRGEQSVDFDVGQKSYQPTRAALGRNREDAGNDGGLIGMFQRGVAEQGMDGRQPRIASPHGVCTVAFEVLEEPPDEWRIEIAELQL